MDVEETIRWVSRNFPTADEQLNEAWERVLRESPADHPEECPLIRGLVKAKMDTIEQLQQTA